MNRQCLQTIMSISSEYQSVPYEIIFSNGEEASFSRENWEDPQSPHCHVAHKRRQSTSVTTRKRAKMICGDENVTDEKAQEIVKDLLDQIQNTPGQVTLNLEDPESAGVCPLPLELNKTVSSEWTLNELQEGQLDELLSQTSSSFKPLGIQKIQKGIVETQVLPRQTNLKETIENLLNENNESDQYVSFAISIANVLRRCDPETAKTIVLSITESIEKEASDVLNR
uniref:SPK domain-containing protein n=1 Tax=Caenorhabditis tropicalis TaxID=1561998 RepID=A0A1I7UG06_9PELO